MPLAGLGGAAAEAEAGAGYEGVPDDPDELGNERPPSQEALARARPRFARKLECWRGSHDFVQSILVSSS